MTCVACGGVRCKGGGNLWCARRDPRPARIAFILDSYGGARTAVGTMKSIRAMTRCDELCHLVPKLIVHEPIAWGDIPIVIERARLEFLKWLDTRPNLTEVHHNSVVLYKLRCLEQDQGSLDLGAIVET